MYLQEHDFTECSLCIRRVLERVENLVKKFWFMVHGSWFMVYDLWFIIYGLGFMVYGLWFGLWFEDEGLGCENASITWLRVSGFGFQEA